MVERPAGGATPLAAPARLPPRWTSLLRLVHPFPSFLVAAVTAAIVPFADRHAPLSLYLTLGVAMLCFQFAIGVGNDLADAHDDALAKPWKAIPRGLVSQRTALAACCALALAGLLLTLRLGWLPWVLGAAGLGCGLVYDFWLKRTNLSWLPYAIALPLLPVWVYVAADAWHSLLWWALPLGVALGLALHLANQAPDAAEHGDSGATTLLGPRRARTVAIALFLAVAFAVTAILATTGAERALIAAAAGAGTLALSTQARFFGRDGLFGVLALGGAGLALVLLSAA